MNFANPQEHVPKVKKNNQVIKEGIRTHYYQLLYKQLTKKDYDISPKCGLKTELSPCKTRKTSIYVYEADTSIFGKQAMLSSDSKTESIKM